MAITCNRTAEYTNATPSEVKIVDGVAVKFSDILVHTFRLGDVDDPDLYAAQPLWDWQQTPAGKWVMAHAVKPPYWTRRMDYNSYGYQFNIIARLSEQNQIVWALKWKNV
jgi:hypothetical protein